MNRRICGIALVCIVASVAARARADIDPVSGIDFVRVGAVGNAPYAGGFPNDPAAGRGGVNYAYSIGKYEVNSGQWAEFFSAVQSCPDGTVPFVHLPSITGGTAHPMYPTGGITWRTAAIFTNWLNNNKDNHLASFMNGAYDVSTFGYHLGGSRFTDQITHAPGARYWIPTWDEWLKAAHYDPNKNGPGAGGWWTYSNGSDSPWVAGPPGVLVNGQPATANYGWNSLQYPGASPYAVPLGAYAATSPFGLYDVAGGTSEWTEEPFYFAPGDTYPMGREYDGTAWLGGSGISDEIWAFAGADSPSAGWSDIGLRIASSVPSPSAFSLGVILAGLFTLQRRRTHEEGAYRGPGSAAPGGLCVRGGVALS